MINGKLVINAVIGASIWYITYLYVRRYLNPENKCKIDKYKKDAFYGALASFSFFILKDTIRDVLNVKKWK